MNRKVFVVLFLIFVVNKSNAQASKDSMVASTPFQVVVRAFEQDRRLSEVPAAVAILNQSDLNRFGNASLVSAINTIPGVKMEERSPGSYRINIRGSSLRSPFGVRNVKVYYNGIPFTDPGGNTYLNSLGFYNFQSVEVIKGPGSSLYGAGTGGVMLIESTPAEIEPSVEVDYTGGSFGLQNVHAKIVSGSEKSFSSVDYQHLQSDGYRNQSNLRRNVVAWDAATQVNNGKLTAHLLYSDLFYQTPGALTLAEYKANPRAARPRAGAAPGAEEARAAIYLKTFFAGAGYEQTLSTHWQNNTHVYGTFAELKNPAIRNYGRNSEPHFGARSVFRYKTQLTNGAQLTWHTGGEVQKAFNTVQVFRNRLGSPDSLLTNDEINNSQFFVFSQLSLQVKKWVVTGGLSVNRSNINFARTSSVPVARFSRSFSNQLAPRLAVLNTITKNISVYASFGKGFSPPTIGELSPSGSAINPDLNAETGYNTELGSRGTSFSNRLSWDVNAFLYRLTNTIVQRRDALGGDYFLNAGSTKQAGLETHLSYRFKQPAPGSFNTSSKVWVSHTWYRFRYNDFKQVITSFSGNRLPGVPAQAIVAGFDWFFKQSFYSNFTYTYSAVVPLNDGNTEYADAYNLLALRLGYKARWGSKLRFEIFAGADNLFDVNYSLGNDINGFGGRYYNAAAGRNYFAGFSFQGLFNNK